MDYWPLPLVFPLPFLAGAILAIVSPERARVFFSQTVDIGVSEQLSRMKSIDIRGFGVLFAVIGGLVTTGFVFAHYSN
jgi:hypothetical protein